MWTGGELPTREAASLVVASDKTDHEVERCPALCLSLPNLYSWRDPLIMWTLCPNSRGHQGDELLWTQGLRRPQGRWISAPQLEHCEKTKSQPRRSRVAGSFFTALRGLDRPFLPTMEISSAVGISSLSVRPPDPVRRPFLQWSGRPADGLTHGRPC